MSNEVSKPVAANERINDKGLLKAIEGKDLSESLDVFAKGTDSQGKKAIASARRIDVAMAAPTARPMPRNFSEFSSAERIAARAGYRQFNSRARDIKPNDPDFREFVDQAVTIAQDENASLEDPSFWKSVAKDLREDTMFASAPGDER